MFLVLFFCCLVWLVLCLSESMGNRGPPSEDILLDTILMKGSIIMNMKTFLVWFFCWPVLLFFYVIKFCIWCLLHVFDLIWYGFLTVCAGIAALLFGLFWWL